MILQEFDMKEEKLNMFRNLKCSFSKYELYEYIVLNHECTINEILNRHNINPNTLYKHIKKLYRMKLIDRDFSREKQKNGSHFTIIARPELEAILKEYVDQVVEFLKKTSPNFDNKID